MARTFLENIWSKFGVPRVVLTDQGTQFQNEFQTPLTQQKITHRVASQENPRANGLAQRMFRTLKQSLRICLLNQTWGLPWDDILPYVCYGVQSVKTKINWLQSLFFNVWETTNFSLYNPKIGRGRYRRWSNETLKANVRVGTSWCYIKKGNAARYEEYCCSPWAR